MPAPVLSLSSLTNFAEISAIGLFLLVSFYDYTGGRSEWGQVIGDTELAPVKPKP
ncbi:hypothetical protein [Synechocystis sp. LKSZ1]|uniref:hypothetical protein n=1 Tax=Synechocystis sp. LKSZ1 TaxID=3144951 RepID=UPI00336BE929